MPLDVRSDHLETVREILRRHIPDREVWAFGSRVRQAARPTSDLDLCIVGDTSLAYETAAALRQAFSDSDIPYVVDVIEWVLTSDSFREIIAREKVVLQPQHAA